MISQMVDCTGRPLTNQEASGWGAVFGAFATPSEENDRPEGFGGSLCGEDVSVVDCKQMEKAANGYWPAYIR
jgi:hypothetical protein